MSLPQAFEFDGYGLCLYERVGFRAPRKGEFFLSGAIVAVYKATADLPAGSKFHIVRPTHYAKRIQAFERGEPVNNS